MLSPGPTALSVAILIPTFNRAEILRRTLNSFAGQQVPDGVAVELIVVDNNSTDHTRDVCEQAALPFPVRRLFEKRQGKCFAMNCALAATTADLLLFTDDDVAVESGWVAAYCDAARRVPQASYFGGRIYPYWDVTPPRWFADHAATHLAWMVLHYDMGAEERFWDESVAGANMAIRREALSGLAFNTALGPDGTETVRGEENDLLAHVRAKGLRGYLTPAAVVRHYTPARRMSETYVRRWFKGDGMTEVRRDQIVRKHPIAGVPRYYWKQLLMNAAKYGLTRLSAPASVWLPAEIEMAKAWGIVTECRRQMKTPRQISTA